MFQIQVDSNPMLTCCIYVTRLSVNLIYCTQRRDTSLFVQEFVFKCATILCKSFNLTVHHQQVIHCEQRQKYTVLPSQSFQCFHFHYYYF